jgi:valyl-tRNA synthetase
MDFFPDEAGNFKPKTEVAQVTLNALVSTFEAALRLLSPFMPFLTEELWHALYASVGIEAPAKSIALTRYPQAKDFTSDSDATQRMALFMSLLTDVRALRKEAVIPEKEFVSVLIHWNKIVPEMDISLQTSLLNEDMKPAFARMGRVKSIEYLDKPPLIAGALIRSTILYDLVVVYERQIDVPAERERLTKDIAKYEKGLEAANKQLSNEGFIARAPTHIVEGLKKQSAETQALYDKARAALAALPPA